MFASGAHLSPPFSRTLQFGNITFQRVCTDRETGQSRGFGFVSFDSEDNANNAIKEMDGAELDGRNIKCNMAIREPKGEGKGGKGEGGGEWSPRPQGVWDAFVESGSEDDFVESGSEDGDDCDGDIGESERRAKEKEHAKVGARGGSRGRDRGRKRRGRGRGNKETK